MTPEQQAAMRQALLAMQRIQTADNDCDFLNPRQADQLDEAITALRQALEQRCVCGEPDTPGTHRTDGPCYAEQPEQQEPVDSSEKAGAYMEARLWEFIDMAATWPEASPDQRTWDHVMVYAPKPAQQEPAATIFEGVVAKWNLPATFTGVLYTRPQAREWVGLTNQELMDLAAIYSGAPLYCAIEAKLREKNT